jgi:hypothetical protein
MKIGNCKLLVSLICLQLLFAVSLSAQEEARAAWQVTNFDINVANLNNERAVNARALVTVRNIGRGTGATLTLRINSKAEIKNVTIGGATAAYRSQPEPRGGGQRVTITLPNAIAANETVVAAVDYRLQVDENAGTSAISPVASQFLPASMWYPAPNTAFAVRGPDYAPFHLTINGASAISSGAEKSAGGNSVFEQTLKGQPFFATGNWDRIDSTSAKAITAFLPKGAGEDEHKEADSLMRLAASAREFFTTMFGPVPDTPIRLVAVKRGAGFDDAGTILLSEGVFRRKKIDSVTALAVAEAVARIWIGANTPVRGEGYGVVREGLVRFFATLFLEKEFGRDTAADERARQRFAYSSIAKRDAPLSRTTPLEQTYFNSVGNKGAMIWRLAQTSIGPSDFVASVRGLLTSGQNDAEGFSLARLRAALNERGGATLKTILDQELDQPTDMDLMVGLPQQQGGQWTAALRNVGSFDVKVPVVATTNSGQSVTSEVTVPAHDFAQVAFQTAGPIARVEVDPNKLYPQIDYTNDVAPRPVEVSSSLAEAMRLFGTQEYAKAEALARQLLTGEPRMQEARTLLARAQMAQNKIDEAEREFRKLNEEQLPTPATLAWSAIGLGEIALRRGQPKDAARLFNEAVRADAEYASTLNARAARIRAEAAAAAAPPVDESAKAFVAQLDTAIRSGRQAEISPLVIPGELSKFVRSAVGTQPELWETRVLRTEQLDANQIAADVSLQTKQLGVEHSGTAVFVLTKVGSAWKLNAIELFEVR